MIFSAVINGVESWRLVMEGKKTQTRRMVKPGEVLIQVAPNHKPDWKRVYCGGSDRVKWDTINTYAIQTGRAKPTVWWEPILAESGGSVELCYAHEWESSEGTLYRDAMKSKNPPEFLKRYGFREGRICITNIRQEDVRTISNEDAIAEGFGSAMEYVMWWVKNYDKTYWREGLTFQYAPSRPDNLYTCWALDFEVVK